MQNHVAYFIIFYIPSVFDALARKRASVAARIAVRSGRDVLEEEEEPVEVGVLVLLGALLCVVCARRGANTVPNEVVLVRDWPAII